MTGAGGLVIIHVGRDGEVGRGGSGRGGVRRGGVGYGGEVRRGVGRQGGEVGRVVVGCRDDGGRVVGRAGVRQDFDAVRAMTTGAPAPGREGEK